VGVPLADTLRPVIMRCSIWAAVLRGLAAVDRIMERTFCAAHPDRPVLLFAGSERFSWSRSSVVLIALDPAMSDILSSTHGRVGVGAK
jgi:hypothetical protein